MKKLVLLMFFTSILFSASAQVSTGFNTSIDMNDFVGWDSNTQFDLNIKHEGNYPIVFSTNNQEQMRLTEEVGY